MWVGSTESQGSLKVGKGSERWPEMSTPLYIAGLEEGERQP